MAYGHGDANSLKRMASIGVGWLTQQKSDALFLLRHKYIEALQRLTDSLFWQEPLIFTTKTQWQTTLTNLALKAQKKYKGLNKAYVEKARRKVEKELTNTYNRYHCQLYGRLLHCHEMIENKDKNSQRLYYYVPIDIQHQITTAELEQLRDFADNHSFCEVLGLFSDMLKGQTGSSFSENQQKVLKEIHRQARQRLHPPQFAKDQNFVCQLHLDVRLIRSKGIVGQLQQQARLLMDSDNHWYQSFLEVSNPIAQKASIKLPLCMTARVLEKLFDKKQKNKQKRLPRLSSLVLELGPDRVEVKAVVSKQKPEHKEIGEYEYLLSRDFGYTNTITLSVVRCPTPIELKKLKKCQRFDKKAAENYLSNHHLREPLEELVVERKRFSGTNFLGLLAKYCKSIDRLKSEIDHIYNKIHAQKAILLGGLGLSEEVELSRTEVLEEGLLQKVHAKFFNLLDQVRHLKKRRKELYLKIASLKKNWFGYLSNIEVKLARQYGAALIREDLNVLAIEKESPNYKGRTFNKMLNNGAKGQYQKRASDKMLWNGISEHKLPAFYTSSCCVVHGIVDKKMRKGEEFRCPKCQEVKHADENAADTLGCYLLLVPI